MTPIRKSFVLHKSWKDDVNKLSNENAGVLFRSIFNFVNNEPIELNKDIEILYYKITEQILNEWNKFNVKTKKYHWNYNGGISNENKIIRNSSKMKYWRISVFERDDYTCQNCNTKGGILNAHHIKQFANYPELRFDIDNGITLCKNCHIKEHKKQNNG